MLAGAWTRYRSSTIRIIRIIFLESYAHILTYETLSYVNHIVSWYLQPVFTLYSLLDFNHKTFTQNRNSFASNTPLLPVYLKQIFLRIPVEGLLFYAVCWVLTAANFVWKCHAPSGYWCLVVKAFRVDLVLPADLCNNTRIIRVFYFLTVHRYFNVWYFIIRVWSSTARYRICWLTTTCC